MNCDACEQAIGFGTVKIFAGRTVCPSCFGLLTAKSESTSNESSASDSPPATVEQCKNCGQSVRVPTDQGTILVTCPKCRSAWDWPPKTKVESTPTTQVAPMPIQRERPVDPVSIKQNNGFAATSFGFGIASVFLYQIGILPLIGIVLGVIGLSTFKEATQKNKWMAITGLVLGVVFLIMATSYWAQFGTSPSQAMQRKTVPVQDPNVPFRLDPQRRRQ